MDGKPKDQEVEEDQVDNERDERIRGRGREELLAQAGREGRAAAREILHSLRQRVEGYRRSKIQNI